MSDYMRARFADGVIADVLRFSVEDLCMGIKDENPKGYADKRIKEDRRNFDLGRWNHVYIFSPAPKSRLFLVLTESVQRLNLSQGNPPTVIR